MDAITAGLRDPQTPALQILPAPQTSSTRNRGGRPRLSDELRKNVRIRVSFTVAEAEHLDELADQAGIDTFQMIRAAALQLKINAIPSINRQALVELGRVGNNLNQAVRRLNSGEDADLLKEILDLQTSINELKSSLLRTA
jgi:hypothetical protein